MLLVIKNGKTEDKGTKIAKGTKDCLSIDGLRA